MKTTAKKTQIRRAHSARPAVHAVSNFGGNNLPAGINARGEQSPLDPGRTGYTVRPQAASKDVPPLARHLILAPAAHPQPTPLPLPAWQRERARVLHTICQRIERQAGQGKPLRRAFKAEAKQLQGRVYRCDPSRPLALSEASLRRIYYRWSQARSVECLMLRYHPTSRATLKPATVRQFLRFAVQPGVWSYRTAYGLLIARGVRHLPSYATLLRAVPATDRARITAEHRRRRQAHQAEQAFAAYARQLARKGRK